MRVLMSSDARILSPHFTDGAGEAANLTAGVPTVAVTRDDGTVLAAPTAVAQTPAVTGQYQTTLTAATHTTRLDWLTVTWTGTTAAGPQTLTQRVEVVGGFYLSVPEMRALGGLDSATDFNAFKLRDTCSEFEDIAEKYTGVAWVPRYCRESFAGSGGSSLLLSNVRLRTVVSASSTDTAGAVTAFTVTNWVGDSIGRLTTDGDYFTPSTYGENNIVVRYTHGHDYPPEDLKRAARIWVQAQLMQDRSQQSRKVLSETDPSGFTYRFGSPNWEAGRPTGIDDVDQILNGLGRRAPMVA